MSGNRTHQPGRVAMMIRPDPSAWGGLPGYGQTYCPLFMEEHRVESWREVATQKGTKKNT